ncbi:MAG: DUF4976 domain-containing protein [Planctomycetes bacterium]|nr:DUF4976 domain-containing protein [Planctomycetota bacterium]
MPSRPNILIFMTDQEQADVVLPEHPCITPSATRLAEQGVLFTQAYTPTAHCCPARASFVTGLYPSLHGVHNNICNDTAISRGLKPGVATFAEPLKAAGYRLFYTGKWHVSVEETPAARGWEEKNVTATKSEHHGLRWEQWEQRAKQKEADGPRQRGQVLRPGWGHYQLYRSYPTQTPKPYEKHHDYKVVQAAVEALPQLAASGQPWCLYVGVVGPHDPFHVPEKYAGMYDPKKVDLPPSFRDTLEDKPRVYQRMRQQYWSQLTEDEVRESIAHYWAYCTMMDDMLGEVLDALDKAGQADDTVTIFTSDHGDYCGAHGLYCKGVPAFREAYNIPLIVRWPKGLAQPGRRVDDFITLADFAPTFIELAGASSPQRMSGRSFLPFLRDQRPADWPDAFYTQFNAVELYYSQRVVQTREFKYVYNGFDFDELYDLRTDPHEMVNVAARPEYESIKRELVRKMWRKAREEKDFICNPYATVALAPYGPADALA